VGAVDGSLVDAADYLARMFDGMGDETSIDDQGDRVIVRHRGLRIVRGMSGQERDAQLKIWAQLWQGTMSSQRELKKLEAHVSEESIGWQISRV